VERTYQGSCHCGKVRFEADIDLSAGTGKCNCSICSKIRLWGVVRRPDAVRLLAGEADLNDYQFGAHSIHHRFCQHCGVHLFWHGYSARKGRAFYTVNIACLDNISDVELANLSIRYFDGRDDNWESSPTETSHL
jgi:hypothetical protein